MKAQSELAGDRKRRAETARPRNRGATIWMSKISDNMTLDSVTNACASAISALDFSGTEAALAEICANLPEIKIDSEVNYRPAWQ